MGKLHIFDQKLNLKKKEIGELKITNDDQRLQIHNLYQKYVAQDKDNIDHNVKVIIFLLFIFYKRFHLVLSFKL